MTDIISWLSGFTAGIALMSLIGLLYFTYKTYRLLKSRSKELKATLPTKT